MSREQRFVFGEVADLYDRARPGYPEALFDDVLALGDTSLPRVLEVGAGTGKATVALAARGVEIVALEPVPEMAALAERNCAPFPRVRVEQVTFEEWPLPSESFDLLIAAQSWHWMPPEVRCRKAFDALRPGGVIALFWNIPVRDDGGLWDDLDAAYECHAPMLRRAQALPQGGPDPDDLDELNASGLFGPFTRGSYRWSIPCSAERYLDVLSTHSDFRLLAEQDRWTLIEAVAGVLEQRGGALEMNYETRLYMTRSLPS